MASGTVGSVGGTEPLLQPQHGQGAAPSTLHPCLPCNCALRPAVLRTGWLQCSLAAGQGSRARWNNAHSSDSSRAVQQREHQLMVTVPEGSGAAIV